MTTTFDPRAFDTNYQQSLTRPPERGSASWRPKNAGRHVIRILPPHPNMGGDPICEMRVHFSLGPKLDTYAPCLEYFGQACPACDWNIRCANNARSVADPNQAKQYKDMAYRQRAQFRYGMNIVDMAHPEAGVQKYYVGSDLEKKFRALFYTDDPNPATGRPDVRDLTHPETGRDIILDVIESKGKLDGKTYLEVSTLRPKDAPSKLMDPAWVDQVYDLVTEDRYQATVEQMQGALQGKRIEKNLGGPRGAPALVAPAPAPLPPLPTRTALGSPAAPPAPGPTAPVAPVPPPVAPVAPVAPPVDAPAPAAPTPPIESPKRGPGRPPKASAAVVAAPVTSAPTRRPMGAVAATVQIIQGPRAAARARVLEAGFTPGPNMDITEEEIATLVATEPHKMPPCYKIDPDPREGACQGCSLLLSCLTHRYNLDAA